MSLVDDRHFDDPNEFLDAVNPRHEGWGDDPGAWVFRGQPQDLSLLAKALRSPDVFREFGIRGPANDWSDRVERMKELLEDFRQRLDQSGQLIPDESPSVYLRGQTYSSAEPEPQSFPLMALAQHHGLPTLFLDWTRRAMAAAYFAAVEAAEHGRYSSSSPLVVWAIRYDSFDLGTDRSVFYQAPGGTNPNLSAQAGLFTRHVDKDDRPLDEFLDVLRSRDSRVPKPKRFLLPVRHAPKLLRLLALEGVTGLSLFPGTDGAVRSLRERTLWDLPETPRRG